MRMSQASLTMMTTIVVAVITTIIAPIIIEWFKTKILSKKTVKAMDEAISFNSLVDEQLCHLMDELSPDNIWVAQFHNGGNFYPTKKSIQKFSVFYEKSTFNGLTISPILQNIPASLFPKALDRVNNETYLEVEDVFSATETYGLDTIIMHLNSKSIYLFGIYSLDDTLIGILGMSYTKEVYKLLDDDYSHITQKIGAIGTLLTNYLYKTASDK